MERKKNQPSREVAATAYTEAVKTCVEFYAQIVRGETEKTSANIDRLRRLLADAKARKPQDAFLTLPREVVAAYRAHVKTMGKIEKHVAVWEAAVSNEKPLLHAESFVWGEHLVGKKIELVWADSASLEASPSLWLNTLARQWGKDKVKDLLREKQIFPNPSRISDTRFEIKPDELFLLEDGELIAPVFVTYLEMPRPVDGGGVGNESVPMDEFFQTWLADEVARFFAGWVRLPELDQNVVKIAPSFFSPLGNIQGLRNDGDMTRDVETEMARLSISNTGSDQVWEDLQVSFTGPSSNDRGE